MGGVVKTILVLPDLQVPYHDPKYIRVLEKFIEDFSPHEVGQIGDLMDQPQPSRWNKGMAGEYATTLQKDVDETRKILKRLRVNWVKLGNHDERVETYVERYAPALASLASLRFEEMLGLDDLGVTYHRKPFTLAPGWVAAHGHEGSLSSVAGRTAFGLAKKFDRSVVCGHTHRAGLVSETIGMVSARRQISGMEVGHGMDLKHATYIKSGVANWQQAFGLVHVDGSLVQAELIPVQGGRFIYRGKVYS